HFDGNPISPGIMAWNGTTWQSVGAGFDGGVDALTSWAPTASSAPQLIAGGDFADSGSATLNSVGRFNGSSWQAFSQQAPGAQVFALTQFGSLLVGAGSFTVATGTGSPANIATWDGIALEPLGSGMN